MQRTFDLAVLGRGLVSPNPLVGCVVVHDGKIIGEGWHKKYGEAHAEVNAIADVSDKTLLPESTVYVNLEPCSHFGKTPPCADLLIREKVKKVVICNLDTNPLVAGEGVRKLKSVGIEVVDGVLAEAGRDLNRRFFTFIEKKRPYIILKWAETSDGFIARENFDSKWISNELSRLTVHKWRSEEDAVLVGKRTAQYDNPRLNVRDWNGRQPTRIVIDKDLQLPSNLNLFDGSQPTLCYNVLRHETKGSLSFVRGSVKAFLKEMLEDLAKRRIQSMIVEGGSETIMSFVKAGFWDEARVFKSGKTFGKGIAAPIISGTALSQTQIQDDVLTIFSPSNS